MPSAASRDSITLPTPGSLPTGSGARKASTPAGFTTNWPSGLRQSLAILARNLFGAMPADAVRPVSSRMAARIASATAVALASPVLLVLTSR
jgi:hypothetical protein